MSQLELQISHKYDTNTLCRYRDESGLPLQCMWGIFGNTLWQPKQTTHKMVQPLFLRFFSFWLSGFWACRMTLTRSWKAFSTFNLCFALASTYLTFIKRKSNFKNCTLLKCLVRDTIISQGTRKPCNEDFHHLYTLPHSTRKGSHKASKYRIW